jgi:hypothetical protein
LLSAANRPPHRREIDVQRDNNDGRLATIKLAKSGSHRVVTRELPV